MDDQRRNGNPAQFGPEVGSKALEMPPSSLSLNNPDIGRS